MVCYFLQNKMRLPSLALALLPLLLLLGPAAAYDMQWQTGRATHYGGEIISSLLAILGGHHVGGQLAVAAESAVGLKDRSEGRTHPPRSALPQAAE